LTRLDLEPAACGAFLDQACGDDLNLRQYVQQLAGFFRRRGEQSRLE
jgi:hypothetical protein